MKTIRLLYLLLPACIQAPSEPNDPELTGPRLLVLQTDYATGLYQEFFTDSLQFSKRQGPSVGDVVLGVGIEGPILIQRSQSDSLLLLDERLEIQVEWPLEAGTNAHDVQVVGDEFFIAAYGRDQLLVLDRNGDEKRSLHLEDYNDADGRPEAHQLFLADSKLYLTLQNLDFSEGSEPQIPPFSRLLVIDPIQLEIQESIEIPTNPFSDLVSDGEESFLLGCNGAWGEENYGGIFSFQKGQVSDGRILITKQVIGGDFTSPKSLAIHGDRIWMTIGTWDHGSQLISFDRSGHNRKVHLRRSDWSLSCLLSQGERLWLCDRAPGASGLRHSGDEFEALIETRLPPTELLQLP